MSIEFTCHENADFISPHRKFDIYLRNVGKILLKRSKLCAAEEEEGTKKKEEVKISINNLEIFDLKNIFLEISSAPRKKYSNSIPSGVIERQQESV